MMLVRWLFFHGLFMIYMENFKHLMTILKKYRINCTKMQYIELRIKCYFQEEAIQIYPINDNFFPD